MNHLVAGKFITLEGLDGSGKSTHTSMLSESLRAEGLNVLVTREPGGTIIGERIRSVVLDSRTSGLAPRAELSLLVAARAQHVEEVILPSLRQGRVVLCDRFIDSTEAYQGGGRKIEVEGILELHRILCQGLLPDLTIILDSDIDFCVARARRRNVARSASGDSTLAQIGDENRFEKESRAFFSRVKAQYFEIARRESDRVAVVDARGHKDLVHREIKRIVHERLVMGVVDGIR